MKLQKASKKDIPIIQSLAKKSWNAAYKGIISQEQIDYMLGKMYSEEELSAHFENPNYHYHLIFSDKIPAGFIGYEHGHEPQTTKLHRIYLAPETQGKGLGKLAINFLKDEVRKSGDARIILNVNKANHAKNVYERLGFKVFEEVVLDIGNGYIMDDYLMEYFL